MTTRDDAPAPVRTGLAWYLAAFVAIPLAVLLAFSLAGSGRARLLFSASVVTAGLAAIVLASELDSSWRLNSCAWSRCPHGLIGGAQLPAGPAIQFMAVGGLLIIAGGVLLALSRPLSARESERRHGRLRSLVVPPI